ncbi:hypothetical protein GCM10022279_18540 [Comamonas faecalis]|uniref:Uncharacterized protein n=1 Tax=Comamonas faecalis TaxID=1387849 RepID=A0ABP7RBN7_9BURK
MAWTKAMGVTALPWCGASGARARETAGKAGVDMRAAVGTIRVDGHYCNLAGPICITTRRTLGNYLPQDMKETNR